MKYLAYAIIWTFICVNTPGCGRSSIEMTFIIPDGFQGVFVVVQNTTREDVDIDAGKVELDVPNSGIVSVHDLDMFEQWIKFRARYQSGGSVSYYDEPPRTEHRLYALGSVPGEGVYFFIGDPSGYEKVVSIPLQELDVGDNVR